MAAIAPKLSLVKEKEIADSQTVQKSENEDTRIQQTTNDNYHDKLRYVYETCQARLAAMQALKTHLESPATPVAQASYFFLREYGMTLTGDPETFKNKAISVLQNYTTTYQLIIKTFEEKTPKSLVSAVIFLKFCAFSYPQFDAKFYRKNHTLHKKNEMKIFKELYECLLTPLEPKYVRLSGYFFNDVNNEKNPGIRIDFQQDVSLTGVPYVNLLSLQKKVFGYAENLDIRSLWLKRTYTSLCSKFLQKEKLDSLEVFLGGLEKIFGPALNPLYKRMETNEIALSASTLAFLRDVAIPAVMDLSQKIRIYIRPIKQCYREFSSIMEKFEEFRKAMVTRMDFFKKTVKQYSTLLTFSEQILNSPETANHPITLRLNELSKYFDQLREEDMKYEAEVKQSYQSGAMLTVEILDGHIDTIKTQIEMGLKLQLEFNNIDKMLQKLQNEKSDQNKNKLSSLDNHAAAGAGADANTNAAAAAAAKVKVHREAPAPKKISLKKWKEEIQAKRQKLNEECKKKRLALTAKAIEEAAQKKRARELKFELSEAELKTREQHILTLLKETPQIKGLFQKLYDKTCLFCYQDLKKLVDSLKQKGIPVVQQFPEGGSSHFAVFFDMEDYSIKGGAFVMDADSVKYPNYIIENLRKAFYRAGFTPTILGLTAENIDPSMLLQYSQSAKQQQEAANTAAAGTKTMTP